MISRGVGAFSQREMVGCEQRSPPVSGSRPQASFKARKRSRQSFVECRQRATHQIWLSSNPENRYSELI
jgi:hypothetical protein